MTSTKKGRIGFIVALVILLLLLWSCAPGYYASVAFDIETTVACQECPEGNPLVPDTKNRAVLYAHGMLWAMAFTLLTERTKHKKFIYGVATALRLLVGVWNLRL